MTASRTSATTSLADASGMRWCTNDWTTIANFPSGYATGVCPILGHLSTTKLSGLADGHTYYGGYVDNNYNGCGWVRSDWQTYFADGTFTNCADPTTGTCTFIYCTNNADPLTAYIWSNADGNDGRAMTTTRTCPMYGNYRPWASGQIPTDFLHWVPNGSSILMRYMARYTYGGGYLIMIHDLNPQFPSGKGNWGFISTLCIS